MAYNNGNAATAKQTNFERLIPHSREAELSVIGSLLIDPDALLEIIGWLQPDHFYLADCQTVYRAILDLHGKNIPHDLVTLSSFFEQLGTEEQNRLISFSMGTINEVPTSVHVKHYAEIVKERAIRRGIISACTNGATLAYDTERIIDDVVGEFQADVFKATSDNTGGKLAHIKEAARVYLEKLENARMNPQALSGLSTGLRAVDGVLGGLRKQDYIVLAGATSMGKTAGALTMVNSLTNRGLSGAVFSLEMSTEQLLNRLVSMRLGIDWESLQTGNINQEQMGRAYTEIAKLSESNLYIDDTPAQTPEQILSKARKLAMMRGIDYIAVDYLGLVHVPEAKGNQYLGISIASTRMKAIAKSLDVPLIALAQINRSNTQRGDKRPTLADLRDSGRIEEDADAVIFIYRDEYYNPDSNERGGVAEWIVRKNRTGGKLGTAETFFRKEHGVFTDLHRVSSGR